MGSLFFPTEILIQLTSQEREMSCIPCYETDNNKNNNNNKNIETLAPRAPFSIK